MNRLSALACIGAFALAAACGGAAPDTIAPKPAAPTERPSASKPDAPADAGAAQANANPDDAVIAAYGQRYVDLVVECWPETATTLGLHTRDSELNDRSLEGIHRVTARERELLDELMARFPEKPRASRASFTDLSILEHALAVDIRRTEALRPHETRPDFYTEPLSAIFVIMARDFAPAADRARTALARIEKLPQAVAAAKTNLKNPSRIATQIGIESADGAKGFLDEQSALLVKELPSEKARITAAVRAAKEAYAGYKAWLTKDLLPRSTGQFAAGKPLFEFLTREDYFLTEDADAIHAMGKRVFDDTQQKLTETARRIDPSAKRWSDVVERVKAHHPTMADLLPSYRREVARARQFLVDKDVMPFPPGDILEVIETPQFRRTTIQAAYDQSPPFDPPGAKGFFYVTPAEPQWPRKRQEEWLRENDHGDQVDTAVHEAYPGHHLQQSFSRLHPSVVRKVTGPSIFSEGWALYSEELFAELGYYTDEERLMQLVWTLVRAARVIIDVGLHTRGMTYDEAVKILVDEVHLGRQLALNEVKRYTENPTQPLSYLIGRERIFAMRERMRARDGARFSLKTFHTEVLTRGTVAPGLLEREIFGE
ncbi:DUF885 domain-containing protein [Pendulispora albinea]|uniref:DUF885 domain-containing protein n=1 Tax=Pendulispora albinea TaxID=2741071 RepID=A0ABZ2LNA1_9BACT